MAARHLLIAGRVQRVGYRDWMCRQAEALGVSGWVRNTRDGRVEAHIEGQEDAVEEILRACRRGPMAARVRDITETIAPEVGTMGFQWRATEG
jgi:acylphosphatase